MMSKSKIVLAGATGFIGKYFEKQFLASGHEVVMISRQKGHINWSDHSGIREALEGASMLINLAGRTVNCRYNETNKAEILDSRTETTRTLGEAVLACKVPPALWLNSSTATIYRHAEDRPMTESTGEIGSGFSVHVATSWERVFFSFNRPETRQVALRIAIVLGEDGGVMTPYKNLVRFGLGGPQGSGKQMFSWIHIEDLYRSINFIASHPELRGPVNCSAPNPVNNRALMKTLRQTMHMPFGLPAPVWMLKLGARMIKTETELILKSRWVLPEKLSHAGFTFTYPTLPEALTAILK